MLPLNKSQFLKLYISTKCDNYHFLVSKRPWLVGDSSARTKKSILLNMARQSRLIFIKLKKNSWKVFNNYLRRIYVIYKYKTTLKHQLSGKLMVGLPQRSRLPCDRNLPRQILCKQKQPIFIPQLYPLNTLESRKRDP